MSELLIFYIVGCVLSGVLIALRTVVSWFIRWITKANIVLRNLKKVGRPDEASFGSKVRNALVTLLGSLVLSWISVLWELWQLLRVVFETLREVLTPTPEPVRALRFPLRTNPDLPRESVWAYVCGLQVLTGELVDATALMTGLRDVTDYYPTFDRRLALRQLSSLHVVDPMIVSDAFLALDTKKEPSSPVR